MLAQRAAVAVGRPIPHELPAPSIAVPVATRQRAPARAVIEVGVWIVVKVRFRQFPFAPTFFPRLLRISPAGGNQRIDIAGGEVVEQFEW